MSRNLHEHVVDTVGVRIVEGDLASGDTLVPDSLAAELGVGRSVIRESLRVLESLGLLVATQRIGTVVRSSDDWNVYDPRLIRWRLAGGGEGAQLRSLTELRLAVEPLAAELAAQHASAEVGGELLQTAARMRTLGRQGDLEGFLELDITFHALVLKASNNEMFSHLGGAVAEVLRGRTNLGLMPPHPHEDALQLHVNVADAIHGTRPEAARTAMEAILRRTYEEMAQVWEPK
jgi:DNA-binding FadR family transcriptional regulator